MALDLEMGSSNTQSNRTLSASTILWRKPEHSRTILLDKNTLQFLFFSTDTKEIFTILEGTTRSGNFLALNKYKIQWDS
jgi:hypothetical protein